MAQQSGGAARKKLSSATADAYTGEDRISGLPDDILVLFLLRLGSTAEAARTSVLSRRWRPVWKLLPELRFDWAPDLNRIRDLIDDSDPDPKAPPAPELRFLSVKTDEDADAESAAAWLPAAARRVTGRLLFHYYAGRSSEAEERGVVQLPCFTKARRIEFHLGFLDLALPPAGTFALLTELILFYIQFHGPCDLGDVVSSPRCPSLQTLIVQASGGIHGLTIHSQSLIKVQLAHLVRFRHLTMVTPALQDLSICCSLYKYTNDEDEEEDEEDEEEEEEHDENNGDNAGGGAAGNGNDPSVQITAPQLLSLGWDDKYDPRYVHFGNVAQVKHLSCSLGVYTHSDNTNNHHRIRLLKRFEVLENLSLTLLFPEDLTDDFQYVMGDVTMLPHIMSLTLNVLNGSHAFGASCYHLLRMCAGLQRLTLQILEASEWEVQCFCSSGCLCAQPIEWKTENLTLMHLEEVVIIDTTGSDHEIAIFNRLFDWAVKLKRLRFKYHSNMESKVNEVHQKLQRFAMPGTCITLEELP